MSDEISTETFFRRARTSQSLNSSHKPKFSLSKRTILITTGIIILVALVVFAGFASKDKGEIVGETFPTPTETPIESEPTEEPTPTAAEETPTPEPSPTPKVSPTPTPKTSVTPTKSTSTSTIDKTSGLDRANLTIEIQNGSGIAGAATKASNILKDLGYAIASSGNADNFDYETTIIQVKSTKKAYLDLLKKDLGTDYTIGEATSDLTGSTADALIIVGKE